MQTPIKTAVIGFGFSAKTFHIPFIEFLDEFALTAISSSQSEAVTAAHPNVVVYETADSLLAKSDAELVIITAPNDVHYDLVKSALLVGKHVIVEKPFVTKSAQGEELIKLAQQKNLVLSVYHNRRWDGDFLTLKKLINDKALGNIRHLESHFDRFRPETKQRWRELASDGGGILFDLGPHLIDQALELFGLPNAVSANCEIWREGSTNIDFFTVCLHYPDKQIDLQASLFCAAPNPRFRCHGDKGSFIKMGLDPQEDQLKSGFTPGHVQWATEKVDDYGKLYNANSNETVPTVNGAYENYFIQMAQAIRGTAEAPVSAESALWNIRIIELAIESAKTGQRIMVQQ